MINNKEDVISQFTFSKTFNMNSLKLEIDNDAKLKNIFGESIIETINTFSNMQKNTEYYLKAISEVINKKYSDFNLEINNHINSTAKKYIKAFGLEELTDDQNDINEKNILIQKSSKNYLKLFERIISLHNNIFESIKENIQILSNFFEISKILDKEKPIQEFLSEEFNNIINSWVFLKIDFEKFNFIKALNNSRISMNMKEFISNNLQ